MVNGKLFWQTRMRFWSILVAAPLAAALSAYAASGQKPMPTRPASAFGQIASPPATPATVSSNASGTNGGAAGRGAANAVELVPGPEDARIARLTAHLLARFHYRQQLPDASISKKFLDQYLNTLDPWHLIFLQTDIDEFERYRTVLGELVFKEGDLQPAFVIFKRYLERFDQEVAFVRETLAAEKFVFEGHEHYPLSRRKAPWPKDKTEARSMWRERLRFEYLQEKLNKKKPDEIADTINRRYAQSQRFLKESDHNDLLGYFLTAFARAYDPHSDYMTGAEMDNFAIGMKLSLFGIGARLQSEDGYCKILDLVPGGPAETSKKIKPNDRIVAVAQGDQEPVDVVGMKLTKVVELIRGPKGTKVRLNIIPADAANQSLRRTVVLVRDEIKLEAQEAKAKVVEEPGITKRLIGVVELPSFYAELPRAGKTNGFKSTTVDVSRLITKLKQEKVQGLILDLRGNGGGLLDEAIRLTGLFIKQGPVVQVRDPGGRVKADDDPDPSILYDGPLVVLTSRLSASASEILAAALQDYGRAVIVGDTSTFGKGTVQELVQLDPFFQQLGLTSTNLNAGTLRVTIRKFYRANGASTQLKGVTPDIVLPSLNNYAEVGESSLPNAMDWDTIDGTKFDAVNCVQACLPELRKRSADRVAHDPDYAYLQEEIARYRKTLPDKTISLNEAERRKEKDELDARQKARKNQLRALADPGRKVFELTLKTVDLPGLPPPLLKTNVLLAATFKAGTNTEDLESKTDEADPPEPDITLAETERILLDLISLTTAKPTLTGITTVTE